MISKDVNEAANMVNREIDSAKAETWKKGSVREWAMESYNAAKDSTYDIQNLEHKTMSVKDESWDLKNVTVTFLDNQYDRNSLPVVKQQIMKAGIRLAELIERSLKE